jgi:hypothetical protein
VHLSKQHEQIFWTEEGIQIVESDEQFENAWLSIHESLESGSNVIVEREVHLLKQWQQILSTEEGIQIVESDEQFENASLSIHESLESDSNLIVERKWRFWR